MNAVTSDIVIFSLIRRRLCVGLVEISDGPFHGKLGLPGTVIGTHEKAADAALRAVSEAGLEVSHIEEMRTFSGPDRDPRGWSLSVSHIALSKVSGEVIQKDFETIVNGVRFRPCQEVMDEGGLAFDHDEVLRESVASIRSRWDLSILPVYGLLHEGFTSAEMRECYEAVLGRVIDDFSFRNSITRLLKGGHIKKVGRRPATLPAKKPFDLYAVGNMETLSRKIG